MYALELRPKPTLFGSLIGKYTFGYAADMMTLTDQCFRDSRHVLPNLHLPEYKVHLPRSLGASSAQDMVWITSTIAWDFTTKRESNTLVPLVRPRFVQPA